MHKEINTFEEANYYLGEYLQTKNEEYLFPIIKFCIKGMRQEYQTREELYEQDIRFLKCKCSDEYRVLYPDHNIGNINILFNAQTHLFKKYRDLFALSAGFVMSDNEGATYNLKDTIAVVVKRKMKETFYNFSQDPLHYEYIIEDYIDPCYNTYINYKCKNIFLNKNKENDINDNFNIKKYLLGLLKDTMNIAFLLTTTIQNDGQPLRDEQARQLVALRTILKKKYNKTTNIRRKINLKELMEEFNEKYTEKRNIYNVETFERLLNTKPEFILEVFSQQSNTVKLYISEECVDRSEVFIEKKQKSEQYSEKTESVILSMERELAKEAFEGLEEWQKYAILRRRVLLNWGYSEKSAEQIAKTEIRKLFPETQGKGIQYNLLLNKAFGNKSSFAEYIKNQMTSNEVPEVEELSKEELLKVVAKNIMLNDTQLMVEVNGLNYDLLFREESEELEY